MSAPGREGATRRRAGEDFFKTGWTVFDPDPATRAWGDAAAPLAQALAAATDGDWRCGDTWFAGVNALPNGADGAIAGAPLQGPAIDFIQDVLALPETPWDRAQISVCRPGYPQPDPGESAAVSGYRRRRDGAHVDGLLRVDPGRRRFLGEVHGFILGIPLTDAAPGSSPFVVWEGSHGVMRAAFRQAFAGLPPERWGEVDVTEAYHAARRRCFETLRRVEISAPRGGAYLAHRLALHGVAPWRAAPDAPERAVAYLRPDPFPNAPPRWWLDAP